MKSFRTRSPRNLRIRKNNGKLTDIFYETQFNNDQASANDTSKEKYSVVVMADRFINVFFGEK